MSDWDRPQTGLPTRAARERGYECQAASTLFPCRRQIPPGVLSRLGISKYERGLTSSLVPWTAGRFSQRGHCRAHRDPPRVGCAARWGIAGGPVVGDQSQHLSSTRSTVCSRYNRQLIDLEYESEWPLLAGNVDRVMSFCCRRFSYNENTLYEKRNERAFRFPQKLTCSTRSHCYGHRPHASQYARAPFLHQYPYPALCLPRPSTSSWSEMHGTPVPTPARLLWLLRRSCRTFLPPSLGTSLLSHASLRRLSPPG